MQWNVTPAPGGEIGAQRSSVNPQFPTTDGTNKAQAGPVEESAPSSNTKSRSGRGRKGRTAPPSGDVLAVAAMSAVGATILDDLQGGELPILLRDVPRESYVPRGRKGRLNHTVIFRWASVGKDGVKLETLRTPSGIITTRSSILRFFSRLSGLPASAVATPAAVRREHERATRELAEAGIVP